MEEESSLDGGWRTRARKPTARFATFCAAFWAVQRYIGVAGTPDDSASIWGWGVSVLGAIPDPVTWAAAGGAVAFGGIYAYAIWPAAIAKARDVAKPVVRTWKMNRRIPLRWFIVDAEEDRRISEIIHIWRRGGETVMVEVPDDTLHKVAVYFRIPEGYRLQFSDSRIQDKAYPAQSRGYVYYLIGLEPLALPARFTVAPYPVFGERR